MTYYSKLYNYEFKNKKKEKGRGEERERERERERDNFVYVNEMLRIHVKNFFYIFLSFLNEYI